MKPESTLYSLFCRLSVATGIHPSGGSVNAKSRKDGAHSDVMMSKVSRVVSKKWRGTSAARGEDDEEGQPRARHGPIRRGGDRHGGAAHPGGGARTLGEG